MENRDKRKIIKVVKKKSPLSESLTSTKRPDTDFWKGKSLEELAKEQGVRPIKDEKDFERIYGGFEDWDDIDDFLKEVHQPWK